MVFGSREISAAVRFVVALLATVGVAWLLRSERFWVFACGLTLGVGVGWACSAMRPGVLRVVAINWAGVVAGLTLAEGVAFLITDRRSPNQGAIWDGVPQLETERDVPTEALGFSVPIAWEYELTTVFGEEVYHSRGWAREYVSEFGMIPPARSRWAMRMVMGNEVVSEIAYEVGEHRERVRPGAPPNVAAGLPLVLAMGDSYTFGWALPHDATYPAQLERLFSDDIRVVNFGQSGWSPAQVARWLSPESTHRPSFEPGQVRFGVVNVIYDHLNRIAGVGGWDGPFYDVREGELIRITREETSSPPTAPPPRMVQLVLRSHLIRVLGLTAWSSAGGETMEQLIRLVLYAGERFRELYDAPLLVVLWDSLGGALEIVAARLLGGGLHVLTEDQVFPGGFNEDYQLGHDPHPNALANALVAKRIAQWARDTGVLSARPADKGSRD